MVLSAHDETRTRHNLQLSRLHSSRVVWLHVHGVGGLPFVRFVASLAVAGRRVSCSSCGCRLAGRLARRVATCGKTRIAFLIGVAPAEDATSLCPYRGGVRFLLCAAPCA